MFLLYFHQLLSFLTATMIGMILKMIVSSPFQDLFQGLCLISILLLSSHWMMIVASVCCIQYRVYLRLKLILTDMDSPLYLVSALLHDFPSFHDDDPIDHVQEVDCMSD